VIFEKNPNSEFFVEESFPLDWMYPYLTPYGVIMKINREPLREMGEDVVKKDHEFWSDYSERLIGNWITYDTPISNITQFAEQVYVKKDYRGFKGNPQFARDDDGQKAFSKLRSSIAGVYAWRVSNGAPSEQARMLKEAEFAFKQAYAFCPYSPEALYRFVNVLVGMRRFDDAFLLAANFKEARSGQHATRPARGGIAAVEIQHQWTSRRGPDLQFGEARSGLSREPCLRKRGDTGASLRVDGTDRGRDKGLR
jgi:hypothetical protein